MKWVSKRKNTGIFAIAVLIIAGIGTTSYLSLLRFKENARLVVHTREVLESSEALLSLLVNAETGQRGYLLTGEQSYLEPYEAATGMALERQIKLLRQLTEDNPNQQKRLDTLESLIEERLTLLKQRIDLRKTQGLEETLQGFSLDRGKAVMDEIRSLVARIKNNEEQLLRQRSQQADASTIQMTVLTVGGSILASVLVSIAALASGRELVRRRQLELTLRQSEARYRAIIEDQTEFITRYQPDGTFTFVNEAYCRYFSLDRETIVGKRYEPVIYEEDRERVAELVNTMNSENPVVIIENRVLVNGEVRWTQWVNRALFDERGNFIEYQSVGRDIDALKQAEAELQQANELLEARVQERTRELALANEELQTEVFMHKQTAEALQDSEERYRKLVELCPDAIFIQSEGKFVYVNEAAVKFYGAIAPQELLGRSIYDFLHPEFRDLVEERIKMLVRDKQAVPMMEEKWLRVDGTVVYGEVAAIPFVHQGKSTVQVVIRDISDRKRSEQEIRRLNAELEERVIQRTAQLEAANKELEAFSYSVSHDLRSPLRSIDGFSQALLEDYADQLDNFGKEYLGRVRKAAQRMAELIDDLLQLSRLTRSQMCVEEVNLSQLAIAIAADLQSTQPERQVELAIAPNLIASGDLRLLKIVLENLLGNAWKFTSKKTQARIEFGLTEDDGTPAYFVRDNGTGFDMAYADKLFGAFQRLHAMTEFEGTGIGLATVQRIVRRHGGRVWAKGEVGVGATFYFIL
jgi:PAS domain S-box-containing protein